MTPKKAARILGLVTLDGLTVESVNAAFSVAVKAAHPDSASGEAPSGVQLRNIKEARDTLRAYAERLAQLEDCPKCKGSGEMPTRRGIPVKCSTCGGDGQIRRREVKRG